MEHTEENKDNGVTQESGGLGEEHGAEEEDGGEEHVVRGKADYCCGEGNVHNQSLDHSSVSSSLDL